MSQRDSHRDPENRPTATQTDDQHPLYQAALDADEAYSDAIHTAYGPKATRWTIPTTPAYAVYEAYRIKVDADRAWLDYMQRTQHDHQRSDSTQPYRTTTAAQQAARSIERMTLPSLPAEISTIATALQQAEPGQLTRRAAITQARTRVRIRLTCNECGHGWRVTANDDRRSDPQCPECNGVDYEVEA